MDETSGVPRYCANCGEISYGLSSPDCPECGANWWNALPTNRVPAYALLLNELAEMRARNQIKRDTYNHLREIYEAKLIELRPPRRATLRAAAELDAASALPPPPPPAQEPVMPRPSAAIPGREPRPQAPAVEPRPAAAAAARPAPAATTVRAPAEPPAPPTGFITPVREWAVRRQADLLLYLGAFMLTISALIFVDQQGSVVTGLLRSAILAGYTAAFLVFGWLLRRWERVQEAGPVFVGIGALLTPLNFLNLYASVLRDDGVPQEWVWLIGSSSTAALYTLLALKDFGRLYLVPAGAAAGVAWGSLGATMGLPLSWFGPWFMVLAGSILLVGWRQYPEKLAWFEAASAAIAIPAIGWAHVTALIDADSATARTALPVTYGMVLAVLAGAGLALRRRHLLALVPPATVATMASAFWAADVLAWEWLGFLVAVGSIAYLVIGHFEPSMRTFGRIAALIGGGAALAAAHTAAPYDGSNAWQLPATYLLLVVTALVEARWWRTSGLFVPILGAAGATAALWAANVGTEWWIYPFVATGLAIGAASPLWKREPVYREWGWPYALNFSLVGAVGSLSLVEYAWHGAATLALTSASFLLVAMRSNGAVAALFNQTSERAVRIEQQIIARLAGWSLLGSAGYAAYGAGLSGVEGGWLFAGIGLAAWAAVLAGRGRIANIEEILAPIGLTSLVAGAIAGMPDNLHVAMVAAAGTLAAPLCAPRAGGYLQIWRGTALVLGFGALIFVHGYEVPEAGETWQLPAVHGLLLAALVFDSAYRRYAPSMLGVPLAVCAFVATLVWYAGWDAIHQVWAPLAVAAAMTAVSLRIGHTNLVGRALPAYASLLALAPAVYLPVMVESATAATIAFAVTAAVWGTFGITRAKPLSWLFNTPDQNSVEPQLWVLASYGFLSVSLAFFAGAADLSPANAAWLFAATAIAALVAPAIRPDMTGRWLTTALICGLGGLALASLLSITREWQVALFLAAGAGAVAANAVTLRMYWLLNLAAGLVAAALGFAWAEAGLPAWSYALVAAGAGVVTYALFYRIRTGATHRLDEVADFLTFAVPLLSIVVAVGALFDRSFALDAEESLVTTAEWLVVAITFATGALLVVTEGVLRAGRAYMYAGALVLLGAVEMAIASFEPTNVQAFTVPVAFYLLGLGFVMRHSEPLFGRHLFVNEGLFVLATLVFVLPPAEQSFAPGGEAWGLLILAEATAILMLGLAFGQRWLTVSGVVTLAAAGGRFAFASGAGNVPNWLVIGIAGLVLLGLGTLLLFERDWWDRTRSRLSGWWLEGIPAEREEPDETEMPPPPDPAAEPLHQA